MFFRDGFDYGLRWIGIAAPYGPAGASDRTYHRRLDPQTPHVHIVDTKPGASRACTVWTSCRIASSQSGCIDGICDRTGDQARQACRRCSSSWASRGLQRPSHTRTRVSLIALQTLTPVCPRPSRGAWQRTPLPSARAASDVAPSWCAVPAPLAADDCPVGCHNGEAAPRSRDTAAPRRKSGLPV